MNVRSLDRADLLKGTEQEIHPKNVGMVTAIHGNIVEIQFMQNLPSINSEVRTGNELDIILEVQIQPDATHVRCIALTPTQGLSRGMKAVSLSEPLKVPVGKETLGHIFDVFWKCAG